LTSRFIRSVPNSSTDPGSTGGSSTHTHAAGSYSGSGHSHTYSGTTSHQEINGDGGTKDVKWNSVGPHSHTYSGSTNVDGGGSISGTSGETSSLPSYCAV